MSSHVRPFPESVLQVPRARLDQLNTLLNTLSPNPVPLSWHALCLSPLFTGGREIWWFPSTPFVQTASFPWQLSAETVANPPKGRRAGAYS